MVNKHVRWNRYGPKAQGVAVFYRFSQTNLSVINSRGSVQYDTIFNSGSHGISMKGEEEVRICQGY